MQALSHFGCSPSVITDCLEVATLWAFNSNWKLSKNQKQYEYNNILILPFYSAPFGFIFLKKETDLIS